MLRFRSPAGPRRSRSDQWPFRADERGAAERRRRGPFPQTGPTALGSRGNYTSGMNIIAQITWRRTVLGICVMAIVPLLHIGTEYLGTGDLGRTLSKLAVSIIGLPILVWGSSAGLRWAARRRVGPPVLLIACVLSAATPFPLRFSARHGSSVSRSLLRPATR